MAAFFAGEVFPRGQGEFNGGRGGWELVGSGWPYDEGEW